MNCVWFEKRLDELLDERLPPDSDAELNEHAATCPDCARLLADHQALLEAIEVLVRPEVRGDLAARILAEVEQEPVSAVSVLQHVASAPRAENAERTLLRAATWFAATTAAALLIGVGLMEWSRSHPAVPFAESPSPGVDTRSVTTEKPVAHGAGEYRGLLAVQSVVEMQSLTTSLISPQQRMLMEQMTDGLKPVTHSMSAALNALRRTLPGSETPARSS